MEQTSDSNMAPLRAMQVMTFAFLAVLGYGFYRLVK
jgi:hypothetical protein